MMAMPTNGKFIDSKCIRNFMQRMGHQTVPKEIEAIIRRLDVDGDNIIKYPEFVESVSPVSPDINFNNKIITRSQSFDKNTPLSQNNQVNVDNSNYGGSHMYEGGQ